LIKNKSDETKLEHLFPQAFSNPEKLSFVLPAERKSIQFQAREGHCQAPSP